MALSISDRQEFLAEPHVASLAVSAGVGRGPLTVPVWYHYTPGEDPWVLTGADSRKAALISQTGRFTLLVHRLQPTVRYVSVEGPAVSTGPATDEDVRRIAARYLEGEALERYLAMATESLGAQSVIRMRPERWLSADLGSW